jgi:tetratricopeptide (TPR) repeat protein
MSKANAIRKKALDLVKKREWQKALNEFVRLAELEKHNPNVFNELGDLHLKLENRRAAFTAFHQAVDEYERNTLYNNAVAVCKKILRLNPSDRLVNAKLGRLRARQGFVKEAENYALRFLDQLGSSTPDEAPNLTPHLLSAAEALKHSPNVLSRIADCLVGWHQAEDAEAVFVQLATFYADRRMAAELGDVKARMGAAGLTPPNISAGPAPADPSTIAQSDSPGPGSGPGVDESAGNETVYDIPDAKEYDIPTRKGDAGDQESAPGKPKPRWHTATPHEYGEVDLGGAQSPAATGSSTATEEIPREESPSQPAVPDKPAEQSGPDKSGGAGSDASVPQTTSPEADAQSSPESTQQSAPATSDPPSDSPGKRESLGENEVWIPDEELPKTLKSGNSGGSGEVVNVQDIVGQFDAEVTAQVDAEDYRSHYDLGMAYLEMDLLPEAIREFQFAAGSPTYQVRCLEMIGLCFLKQDQPRLAVKQLEKAVEMSEGLDKESLGLQYNLGLAYEKLGDTEKAKICFEEVYVIDVTFRDVAEKIAKYK